MNRKIQFWGISNFPKLGFCLHENYGGKLLFENMQCVSTHKNNEGLKNIF